MARILLVDDEINLLKMTQMMLTRAGHEVVAKNSGKNAIEELAKSVETGTHFDVVVTDYRLNDITGLDVLHASKRLDDSVQVLLVTAYATAKTAVEAMHGGAFDYIEKPFKRDELLALIDKAYARHVTMRGQFQDEEHSTPQLPNLVAESESMKNVMELVRQVAPTRATILITGESGTGKEVIARAVHRMSNVSGPFIPVNCGAIPETLVESEFFGYTKGAFTGATKDKQGFFQAAQGGTLFLDEIGELPLSMQVKLLRAIQEKKVQPVGSPKEDSVCVRIIAATNRDLRVEVDAHRFREDLFFRLNVIQIALPPLRNRTTDIPVLIHHFLHKFNDELGKTLSGIQADALDILMKYDYRGNVRELENILEHAATLEQSSEISVKSLPAYLKNRSLDGKISSSNEHERIPSSAENIDKLKNLEKTKDTFDSDAPWMREVDMNHGIELEGIVENLERRLIEQSLKKTNGNKTEAARLLGISFRSLRYRLKKYGYE